MASSDKDDKSKDKGKVDWSKKRPYQDDANERTGTKRDDDSSDEYRSSPSDNE